MSNDKATYQRIEQYLRGELQGVALDKFKADLKKDPELQQALAMQEAIVESIRQVREQELRAYIKEHTSGGGRLRINRLQVILSAAAAIAIIAVATILLNRGQEPSDPHIVTNTEGAETVDESLAPEPDAVAIDSLKQEETRVDSGTLAMELTVPEMTVEEEAEDMSMGDADMDIEPATEELAVAKSGNIDQIEVVAESRQYSAPPNRALMIPDSTIDAVKTDILLGVRAFVVNTSQLELEYDKEGYVYNSKDGSEDLKDRRTLRKRDDIQTNDDAGVKAPSTTKQLQVEFWSSVVNFTGYTFSGSSLKLYGIDLNAKLKFQQLDNRLYLEMGGKHYFIDRTKENKYLRLVEVTNTVLLDVLNDKN